MQTIKTKLFFQTAIYSMLIVGASWGTWLLIQLYRAQEFTKLNVFEVNAHGQAQIFGWIGMMIIGALYVALPRLFSAPIPYPVISLPIWALLSLGTILSTVGLLFKEINMLTFLGGFFNLIAVLLVIFQLGVFFSRIKLKNPAILYALTALAFLGLSTAFSLWHHGRLVQERDQAALLAQVATFQAPLRDLQVHGMGLFMALAMMQWIFFHPKSSLSYKAYAWLLSGVALEIFFFLLYRFTHNHLFAAFLTIPWGCLLIGSFLLLFRGKLINHLPPLARLATGWLLLSEVMLVLLPFYSLLSHLSFSHAYYGAIRHAVTVGFLSQMIFLMAPTLLIGNFPVKTFQKRIAFFLLNVGCLARVSLQILSDFYPEAYHFIFLSGLLELSATLVWGLPLLAFLRKTKEGDSAVPSTVK